MKTPEPIPLAAADDRNTDPDGRIFPSLPPASLPPIGSASKN